MVVVGMGLWLCVVVWGVMLLVPHMHRHATLLKDVNHRKQCVYTHTHIHCVFFFFFFFFFLDYSLPYSMALLYVWLCDNRTWASILYEDTGLVGIGIPIINLRQSDDLLRFIMRIPKPVRWCLLSECSPWLNFLMKWKWGYVSGVIKEPKSFLWNRNTGLCLCYHRTWLNFLMK